MWVRKTFILFCFFLSFQSFSFANIEKITVCDKPLTLNGSGTFTKLLVLVKIPVFEGSLYLENPTNNAKEIINSSQVKLMRMKFLLGVSKKRMQKGWKETFKERCGTGQPCEHLKKTIETLISWMPETEKDDIHEFLFYPDRVEFRVNSNDELTSKGSLSAPGLAAYLLEGWVGSATEDKSFQAALLGTK